MNLTQEDTTRYHKTCIGRPPFLHSKNSLSRQVVAHTRLCQKSSRYNYKYVHALL